MVKEERTANANLSAVGNIINAMSDGVALFNLEGKVTQINKAASEMLGYGAREAIGKPITDFVPQRMVPEFEEMIKETLEKGLQEETWSSLVSPKMERNSRSVSA